jgi:hypothetical protein
MPLRAIAAPLVAEYGMGCPGENGIIPQATSSGLPVLGHAAFSLDLASAKASAPTILAVHVSRAAQLPGGPQQAILGDTRAAARASLPSPPSTEPRGMSRCAPRKRERIGPGTMFPGVHIDWQNIDFE